MRVKRFIIPMLLLFLAIPLAAQDEDVPADYDGVLVRNDFTAIMRGGDLEITVTAMDKSIIDYATVEMKDHLNRLKDDRLAENLNWNPDDPKCPIPFLVYFRALGQEIRYEPRELLIYNYGKEYRPIDVVPISPKFNDKVTYIRRPPVGAIYLFDRSIDLESQDLIITYANVLVFSGWLGVIEKLRDAKTQYELYRTRNKDKQ
ncbi:MAG: hypothetical protein U9N45_05855 [Gemmatimonadota bacterium]|nr:hypothetical protein [Gemmatimonadota bacterium]